MKSLYKSTIAVMALSVLLFTGCEKWIDTDLNTNPDVPSDVPMNLIVPSMELSMSYQIGGIRAVKTTNIYMQFLNGVARQSYGESNYILSATDVDDLWRRMYYQPMMDATRLIQKAGEQNSPHYAGVAKVCMALCLGTMTNLFGDIPYSDAFTGDQGGLQPEFDTQEEIYNSIELLLEEAIVDLGSTENILALKGDIIFNNNRSLWTKAAYALKARYALYRNDFAGALASSASAFSPNDKFIMAFGTTDGEAGPMFQYATVSSYKNDVKMCATFIDKLLAAGDPRLPFYAKTFGGAYVGSPAGSEEPDASALGVYNNKADAPVVLSSYAEMQFIRAECFLRQPVPDGDAAAAAFKAAVASSVLAVTGEANTDWLDANINTETGATITLEKIIEQKYLAMYSTVVPYDDYRRTGYPALTPVAGAGQIPERFPYPQTEISYNTNCPVIANTSEQLWIFD